MKELLLTILRAIVQHPEAVELTRVEADATTFLELRCHPDDVGIVIGKNGKTISAIRVLLNCVSGQDDRKAILEIIEPA